MTKDSDLNSVKVTNFKIFGLEDGDMKPVTNRESNETTVILNDGE